jgi:subtilisin family serine protease
VKVEFLLLLKTWDKTTVRTHGGTLRAIRSWCASKFPKQQRLLRRSCSRSNKEVVLSWVLSLAFVSCASELPNAINPAIQGNHELSGRITIAGNANPLEAQSQKSISEQTAAGFLDAPQNTESKPLNRLEQRGPMDASGPNDPEYALQANLRLIGLPRAWQDNPNNKAVLVAVLDDGYDPSLFDMTNRIDLPTPPTGRYLDTGNRDNDPRANSKSHGSAVASVIAAATNNSTGIAGITSEVVRVVPIKVFTDAGKASTETIAAGLETAISIGARVANISLGIEQNDTNGTRHCVTNARNATLDLALRHAAEAGVLVIAASGNDGSNHICYPASNPDTLAVGSINDDRSRSGFSSHGAGLDLVAPGNRVLTISDAHITTMSGTSFSAPTVAGVAALLFAQGISSSDLVFARLLSTANDLGDAGRDGEFGAGLVRADLALEMGDQSINGSPMTVTVSSEGGFLRVESGTFSANGAGAYSVQDLPAATYTIRVLVDRNSNGLEDVGDLTGSRIVRFDGAALYSQDVTLEQVR